MHRLPKRFLQPQTWIWIVAIAVLAVSLIMSGCKSSEDPDDDTDDEDEVVDITVVNDYGETLDIYLDDVFQFSIAYEDTEEIKDVSEDEHRVEARKVGTTQEVAAADLDLSSGSDYTWTIDDPADINVTNSSGINLKIYLDGVYVFDLIDEENRWIMNATFGERRLKACKASDNTEYASTTLDVEENKDYAWTIY